ncbi:MAG: hypothetical protein RIQ81_2704 [Pseudomonadota bacterium]
MKKSILSACLICAAEATVASGASFPEVWSATKSGPYQKLPEHQVTLGSFYEYGVDRLKRAVDRTLSDDRDILPTFQKLVHPVGICFAGTWSITERNPYTGYFAKGSEGLIIVRASEAMGNARRGSWRSFGLAGKIFPTTDRSDPRAHKTANFFTIDDLGGTGAENFLDTDKTNEPDVSTHLSSIFNARTLLKIVSTFKGADENPTWRPVESIAGLGVENPRAIKAPRWMMLRSANRERVNHPDFRNELDVRNYDGGLRFDILVSDTDNQDWREIGQITLNSQTASEGCDHRLHFTHPRVSKR